MGIFPALLPAQNQLGVYVSPDINYRWLYRWEDDQASTVFAQIKGRNAIERPLFGVSYGVLYGNSPKPNINIEGGVGLCLRGEKTEWFSAVNQDSQEVARRFLYKFRYLDLPMRMKIFLGKDSDAPIRLYLSPGFTGHLMMRYVFVQQTDRNGNITTDKTVFANNLSVFFRNVSASIALGGGVDFRLSSNTVLSLQPEFRYHVSALSAASIREFFYSAGLRTSMTFDLGE